jgi:molybdopterin-binding protein
MAIRARNQLKGKIIEIVLGDVMAHVTVRVGQNLIESVITRKSADELKSHFERNRTHRLPPPHSSRDWNFARTWLL